jgi:hypothetical protein
LSTKDFPSSRLDKAVFSVSTLSEVPDGKAFWLARTPEERLRHVEILRRVNYGHHAAARLQRILEIVLTPQH